MRFAPPPTPSLTIIVNLLPPAPFLTAIVNLLPQDPDLLGIEGDLYRELLETIQAPTQANTVSEKFTLKDSQSMDFSPEKNFTYRI